jgi:hypothetical protein
MDEKVLGNIITSIENSPIWKDLNDRCKKVYEEQNRVPSKEEYQALRNVLICKVILDDSKVHSLTAGYVYSKLTK